MGIPIRHDKSFVSVAIQGVLLKVLKFKLNNRVLLKRGLIEKTTIRLTMAVPEQIFLY